MNLKKLEFGNVRLRPLEPEDLELLYEWENDLPTWKVSNTLVPFSKYILKQYIEESHRDIFDTKQLRLVIEDLSGKAVGAIDLFDFDPYHQRAGIGILIHATEDRRKGLALDAIKLMARYSLKVLGLHQIYANITIDNLASINLFEKAGFKKAGVKKDWRKISTGWLDETIYQLIL